MNINTITITGYLNDVKSFDKVSRGTINAWQGKDKEKLYIQIVAFRENVSLLQEHEGQRVEVEGRLATNNFEDSKGNKRYGFQIIVNDINPSPVEPKEKVKEQTKEDEGGFL